MTANITAVCDVGGHIPFLFSLRGILEIWWWANVKGFDPRKQVDFSELTSCSQWSIPYFRRK